MGGAIVGVNDAAVRLLGWSAQELEGRPLASILAEESMGAWMMQALLQAGSMVGEEFGFVARDSSRIPVLCSGLLLGGDPGRPDEMIWLARKRTARGHLTERMEALEELLQRERAERLRLAAELKTARELREKEGKQQQFGNADPDTRAKDQLWAWAEEELRRVQTSFQRTRERLARVEEDLERTLKDREWVDERRRRSEQELHRVREELQRMERKLRAAENERGAQQNGSGNGNLPWLPAPEHYSAALQRAAELPREHGVDWNEALAGVDGDLGFLRAIADVFASDAPRLLGEIRAATDRGDAELVERGARTLMGAAQSLGAAGVAQAAARLEELARSGGLDGTEDAYITLQLEIEKIAPALAALREMG